MAELTLVGLRVVREVASRGSFTAAAEALGYTQSAVSRQVALTEQAAGAALFERLARGVRPTHAGRLLLAHAEAVLARVDAALLELEATGEELTARVTLGAFPTALAALVPRALARLAEEHPDVEVRLREGGSAAQLRRLRARRVDVALVAVGAGLDYDLDDLLRDRVLLGGLRLVVGAGHRFAARGWVTPQELAGERWVVGAGDGSGPQFGTWPSLDDPADVAYAVRDWPARLGLVAAGLGIAVLPAIVDDAIPAGLRVVAVEDPRRQRREALAVTRADRGAAEEALVDALRVEGRAIEERT